jgi:hypothetical protein
MTKNSLFTTSILVAAAAAAGFFGCSSNSGSDSSVGSGSSSGGLGSGSNGGPGDAGSSSSGGHTGDAAACVAPSSVPNSSLPAYTPVVPMMNACTSMQISGFISSCVQSGTTSNGCVSWADSNATCAGCIVQGTDAGLAQTGAILFNVNPSSGAMVPVSSNVPGCIALADPTNGPACAEQLEPLMQCVAEACGFACTDQTSFSSCEQAVRASGGACGNLASAAQMPCATDMASSGVGVAKCGYGTQNELQEVINVICGTGP